MENLDLIMETFEPKAKDTFLETLLLKMAEEDQPQGNKFLQEVFSEKKNDESEQIFHLTQAYLKTGFAVGYLYGQMFELCDKEAAEQAVGLKQKLIDEGLLKYRPRGGKKPNEKQNVKALVEDAIFSILAIATVGEEAYQPNDETWAPGKLFQIIKREAQTITDSF